jgi:endonuclease/exonuclease/phosphatase (EEP) superfamily protein YafD
MNRKKLGQHLIVVGDLNTSPWSAEFMTLTKKTGLRDSQLGYGLQPSWPMLLPYFGVNTQPNLLTQLLQVPIDHVLVSEQIQVFSRHTGPFIGSDHLPVTVELGWSPNAF